MVALAALAATPSCGRGKPSSSPTGPDCETEFGRQQYPDKWRACKLCEKQHRGMGSMEADCKNVIPKPWK